MKRPPLIRLHADELIVDNFAGGGGASTGIEMALDRSPDIAINHDPEALAMHAANHPATRHYCTSVWDVDPVEVCGGKPVGLAWFSPDCTFHSKARGSKPFRDRDQAKRRRGLAWVVVRWAKAVKPRIIALENVEEFEDWGPLLDDGRPDPLRRGFTFRRWKKALEKCGYVVESRELRACDYGAPTSRKRLFVVARCDGQAITWPDETHGKGRSKPYRTAAECIDWSIPCPSIFERERPLADNTLRRIARGIRRYVLEDPSPFLVPYYSATSEGGHRVADLEDPLPTQTTANRFGLVTPFLAPVTHPGDQRVHSVGEPFRTITGAARGELAAIAPTLIQVSWGERPGQAPRVPGLHKPIGTLMAQGGKHALICAFLAKHFGGTHPNGTPKCPGATAANAPMDTVTARNHSSLVSAHLLRFNGSRADREQSGADLRDPLGTITAAGLHFAQVYAFLARYNGQSGPQPLTDPIGTLDTGDRYGLVLVTIAGVPYIIVDIGMRMLTPRELFRAQGFCDAYQITPMVRGKPLTKTAQVRMCGNSVPPQLVSAIVSGNCRRVATPAEQLELVASGSR